MSRGIISEQYTQFMWNSFLCSSWHAERLITTPLVSSICLPQMFHSQFNHENSLMEITKKKYCFAKRNTQWQHRWTTTNASCNAAAAKIWFGIGGAISILICKFNYNNLLAIHTHTHHWMLGQRKLPDRLVINDSSVNGMKWAELMKTRTVSWECAHVVNYGKKNIICMCGARVLRRLKASIIRNNMPFI